MDNRTNLQQQIGKLIRNEKMSASMKCAEVEALVKRAKVEDIDNIVQVIQDYQNKLRFERVGNYG